MFFTNFQKIVPKCNNFGKFLQRNLPKTTIPTFQQKSSTTTQQSSPSPSPSPSTPPTSTSFVQNIFVGVNRTSAVASAYFPYPKVLNDEELSLIEMVSAPVLKMYQTEYDPLAVEHTTEMEEKHLRLLKEVGTFGIQVPPEHGGMGFNNTQYARLVESTCGHDLGIAIFIGSHQSIGYKGLLLYGTEEQKEKYLPVLATGEKYACFALTEPSAGSDAKSIKTRATLSDDGRHWILNGAKTFISNGGIADYFTVFAQTPVRLPNGEVKDKITAFWVQRGPGLSSGPPMDKMGIKASNTTEVYFDNVQVPVENVLGEVGEGFKVAMNILNNGRYGMCCGLSGTMRKAIESATEHANRRIQFGNKLADFAVIQEKIARMSMRHYVTQSMAYMLSGLMDNQMKDFQLEAAISKVYASESAWFVVDEALQIFGGMGYMRETGVEKLLRDVRIFRIFEGANEVLRQFISLTGIQSAGERLKVLQKAMKNPTQNFGVIFDEGTRRLQRSIGLNPSGVGAAVATFGALVHPNFATEAATLVKHIDTFSTTVEQLLIKHQRNIIREQMVLARLANATIDIYTMLVVLSRVSRALEKQVPSASIEQRMAKVICAEASVAIEQNLHSLLADRSIQNDDMMQSIAKDVLQNGGLVHEHPLD